MRHALDSKHDRRTRKSAGFVEGGYFVLSHGPSQALVDCGELGYLSIAAHGHADCLSLLYGTGGRWLTVDPGTFCYHGSRDWRDHFRSTSAHNTVAIDGRNQSEIIGPFMWGARARAKQRIWCTTLMGDVFEGSSDGYGPSKVTHTRTVALMASGACVVMDRLTGSGRHDVSTGFQFPPGVSVTETASSMKALRAFEVNDGKGGIMTVHAGVLPGLRCGVAEGGEDPKAGWTSRGFGERSPAPRLQLDGEVDLPAVLVTVLVPGDATAGASVRVEGDGHGMSASIGSDAGRQRLVAGRVRFGNLVFDGAFGMTLETESKAGMAAPARGAVGLDIREWTVDGEPVDFEQAVNQL